MNVLRRLWNKVRFIFETTEDSRKVRLPWREGDRAVQRSFCPRCQKEVKTRMARSTVSDCDANELVAVCTKCGTNVAVPIQSVETRKALCTAATVDELDAVLPVKLELNVLHLKAVPQRSDGPLNETTHIDNNGREYSVLLSNHNEPGKDMVGTPADINGRKGVCVAGTSLTLTIRWD